MNERLTTPGSIVLSFPEGQNPEGESAGMGGERGGVDSALEESSDKEDAGEEFATESMRDQWYPE